MGTNGGRDTETRAQAEGSVAGIVAGRTTGLDRHAAVTRALLGYGMLVGPFYLAVGLLQALLRDGFDLSRHALSQLANGPWGWVQTANFTLSGLMVIAAAIGARRVLGRPGRSVSLALGAYGGGMLAAAVFPADASLGFPPGTPEGYPTTLSTAGAMHFVAGAFTFAALAASGFLAARVMAKRQATALARLSFVAGLVVAIGFFGGVAISSLPSGILGIWVAVVVGWAWLAIFSRHLYRVSPDPNC